MGKTLVQIVTAAFSFCLAQPSFGQNGKTLEDSFCPATVELVRLSEGRNIVFRPLLFCYQEPQPEDFLSKFGYMTNVKAYYTVEGTVVKDSWSGKDGYPRLLRQIIVSYDMNNNHYAIRFITDPKADGIGLADRPGAEVIDIHVTYPDGRTEKNGFIWQHRYLGFIFPKEDNTTMKGRDYLQGQFDKPAAQIMNFLRRRARRGHRSLKRYYINYEPEKNLNTNPVIFVEKDVEKLHRFVYDLERKADKVNGKNGNI